MDMREKLINLFETIPHPQRLYPDLFVDMLIENSVTIQEWIPISQLPKEKRKDYLCYYKYEPESPDVICENFYYGGGLWLSETDKVTHWMPLMKRPKENE